MSTRPVWKALRRIAGVLACVLLFAAILAAIVVLKTSYYF